MNDFYQKRIFIKFNQKQIKISLSNGYNKINSNLFGFTTQMIELFGIILEDENSLYIQSIDNFPLKITSEILETLPDKNLLSEISLIPGNEYILRKPTLIKFDLSKTQGIKIYPIDPCRSDLSENSRYFFFLIEKLPPENLVDSAMSLDFNENTTLFNSTNNPTIKDTNTQCFFDENQTPLDKQIIPFNPDDTISNLTSKEDGEIIISNKPNFFQNFPEENKNNILNNNYGYLNNISCQNSECSNIYQNTITNNDRDIIGNKTVNQKDSENYEIFHNKSFINSNLFEKNLNNSNPCNNLVFNMNLNMNMNFPTNIFNEFNELQMEKGRNINIPTNDLEDNSKNEDREKVFLSPVPLQINNSDKEIVNSCTIINDLFDSNNIKQNLNEHYLNKKTLRNINSTEKNSVMKSTNWKKPRVLSPDIIEENISNSLGLNEDLFDSNQSNEIKQLLETNNKNQVNILDIKKNIRICNNAIFSDNPYSGDTHELTKFSDCIITRVNLDVQNDNRILKENNENKEKNIDLVKEDFTNKDNDNNLKYLYHTIQPNEIPNVTKPGEKTNLYRDDFNIDPVGTSTKRKSEEIETNPNVLINSEIMTNILDINGLEQNIPLGTSKSLKILDNTGNLCENIKKNSENKEKSNCSNSSDDDNEEFDILMLDENNNLKIISKKDYQNNKNNYYQKLLEGNINLQNLKSKKSEIIQAKSNQISKNKKKKMPNEKLLDKETLKDCNLLEMNIKNNIEYPINANNSNIYKQKEISSIKNSSKNKSEIPEHYLTKLKSKIKHEKIHKDSSLVTKNGNNIIRIELNDLSKNKITISEKNLIKIKNPINTASDIPSIERNSCVNSKISENNSKITKNFRNPKNQIKEKSKINEKLNNFINIPDSEDMHGNSFNEIMNNKELIKNNCQLQVLENFKKEIFSDINVKQTEITELSNLKIVNNKINNNVIPSEKIIRVSTMKEFNENDSIILDFEPEFNNFKNKASVIESSDQDELIRNTSRELNNNLNNLLKSTFLENKNIDNFHSNNLIGKDPKNLANSVSLNKSNKSNKNSCVSTQMDNFRKVSDTSEETETRKNLNFRNFKEPAKKIDNIPLGNLFNKQKFENILDHNITQQNEHSGNISNNLLELNSKQKNFTSFNNKVNIIRNNTNTLFKNPVEINNILPIPEIKENNDKYLSLDSRTTIKSKQKNNHIDSLKIINIQANTNNSNGLLNLPVLNTSSDLSENKTKQVEPTKRNLRSEMNQTSTSTNLNKVEAQEISDKPTKNFNLKSNELIKLIPKNYYTRNNKSSLDSENTQIILLENKRRRNLEKNKLNHNLLTLRKKYPEKININIKNSKQINHDSDIPKWNSKTLSLQSEYSDTLSSVEKKDNFPHSKINEINNKITSSNIKSKSIKKYSISISTEKNPSDSLSNKSSLNNKEINHISPSDTLNDKIDKVENNLLITNEFSIHKIKPKQVHNNIPSTTTLNENKNNYPNKIDSSKNNIEKSPYDKNAEIEKTELLNLCNNLEIEIDQPDSENNSNNTNTNTNPNANHTGINKNKPNKKLSSNQQNNYHKIKNNSPQNLCLNINNTKDIFNNLNSKLLDVHPLEKYRNSYNSNQLKIDIPKKKESKPLNKKRYCMSKNNKEYRDISKGLNLSNIGGDDIITRGGLRNKLKKLKNNLVLKSDMSHHIEYSRKKILSNTSNAKINLLKQYTNLDNNTLIITDLSKDDKSEKIQTPIKKLKKLRRRTNIIHTYPKPDSTSLDKMNRIFTQRCYVRPKTCTICLDEIRTRSRLDKCKHEFCKECIDQWAQVSSECPLCKIEFNKIWFWVDKKRKCKRVKKKTFTFEDEESEDWLENCAENCMVCNKSKDQHLLLLCDKCTFNICHTYCAGLDIIPDEEWFCFQCREKNPNTQKVRKISGTQEKELSCGNGYNYEENSQKNIMTRRNKAKLKINGINDNVNNINIRNSSDMINKSNNRINRRERNNNIGMKGDFIMENIFNLNNDLSIRKNNNYNNINNINTSIPKLDMRRKSNRSLNYTNNASNKKKNKNKSNLNTEDLNNPKFGDLIKNISNDLNIDENVNNKEEKFEEIKIQKETEETPQLINNNSETLQVLHENLNLERKSKKYVVKRQNLRIIAGIDIIPGIKMKIDDVSVNNNISNRNKSNKNDKINLSEKNISQEKKIEEFVEEKSTNSQIKENITNISDVFDNISQTVWKRVGNPINNFINTRKCNYKPESAASRNKSISYINIKNGSKISKTLYNFLSDLEKNDYICMDNSDDTLKVKDSGSITEKDRSFIGVEENINNLNFQQETNSKGKTLNILNEMNDSESFSDFPVEKNLVENVNKNVAEEKNVFELENTSSSPKNNGLLNLIEIYGEKNKKNKIEEEVLQKTEIADNILYDKVKENIDEFSNKNDSFSETINLINEDSIIYEEKNIDLN